MVDSHFQSRSPQNAGVKTPELRAEGWTYRFLEAKDAGIGTDDHILVLYRIPNRIRRALGAAEERVSYYCRDGEWYDIGGSRAGNRVSNVLRHAWSEYLAQDSGHKTMPEMTASDHAERMDRVQQASEESFPASDAPAWTTAKV
jgi:hypothetical protein